MRAVSSLNKQMLLLGVLFKIAKIIVMIDEEEYSAGPDDSNIPENIPDLETQEQLNNEAELQRIKEENVETPDESLANGGQMGTAGEVIEGGRIGEELALQQAEMEANMDNRPNTKNLLGDNPPGSEDVAFEAGQTDISSRRVKYNAENIRENFRENIDKTTEEIELDKELKRKSKTKKR